MSSVKMNDGVKMNFDNIEYTNKLKYANECLGICDDLNIEKNRNIVFIYSPPKVGSTTLVSSIRLSAAHKFSVHHIHNEIMLKVLYNITNIAPNRELSLKTGCKISA